MKFPSYMPARRYQPMWLVLLGLCLLVIGAQPLLAQFGGRDRGGRSRGGFGPGGGGLAGTLRDETVRQQLGITEEQMQKLEALDEAARASMPDMREMFSGMRDASPEEQEAMRDAMRAQFEKMQQEGEERIKSILSPEQFAALRSTYIRSAGTRALTRADVVAELGLTQEQQDQIRALQEDRSAFSPEMFRMSEEEREKLRQEREAKVLAVLSAEQRQKWDAMVAPADAAAQPAAGTSPVPATGAPGTAMPAPGTPGASPMPIAGQPGQIPGGSPGMAPGVVPGPAPGGVPGMPPTAAAAAPGVPAPAVAATPGADASALLSPDGTEVPHEVVSTFQADGAPTDGGRPEFLSFNFSYAPWADVLKLFADAAGLSIDLQAVPPGTFTYYDKAKYTPTEALDVLNGYLLPKGFILVRRDNFLVSLSIQAGIPDNLVPIVELDDLAERGKNELISVILPLKEVTPQRASEEAQKLVGPQGKVVALEASNSLLVRDVGANVRRIVTLMSDVSYLERDQLAFQSFPLKFIQAVDAERQVRNLFGLTPSTKNVSANNESRSGDSRRGGFPPWMRGRERGEEQQQQPAQQTSSDPQQMRVSADSRTNRLLVNAKPAQLKLVEEVLTSIDVPESDEVARTLSDNTPTLRVYEVQDADATEVTKTLDAIMPGVVINEDGRNGYIHIMATPAEHREVEELIRRLDGSGTKTVDVIRLSRMDPYLATELIDGLFAQDGRNAPTVQPDSYSRTLAVRATADQMVQIRKTLQAYGEDGTGRISPTGSGRFRTVNLAGRDPAKVARMLEQVLSGNQTLPYEIKVVAPPADSGPVRERLVPGRPPMEGVAPAGGAPAAQPPARPGSDDSVRRQRPPVALAVYQNDDSAMAAEGGDSAAPAAADLPPAPPWPQPPAELTPPAESLSPGGEQPAPVENVTAAAKSPARVNIEVRGDQLFLYSADEQALDQVEMAISQLAYDLPAESIWTVFYLQLADATEMASRLKELIPDSSVVSNTTTTRSSGSFFSPFSFFGASGSSSASSTPTSYNTQTLRIIPDTRTNALFVTGPADKVKDVEQFLRVLDAADRPESLRDRLPRMIAVEYADASAVAEMLKEIYADYLGNSRQQQPDPRGGPMAMMMGGGNNASRPGSTQLTLAVDMQSNTLVVSASDALFRQISETVAEIDRAAYEAQPTTRIVALDAASSAAVQQALSSLTPKIQISTTTSSTASSSRTSGGASGGAAPGGSGDAAADAMREMFRRRMMERMGSGGSGAFGPPSGFPGGGFSGRGYSRSGSDRGSRRSRGN